SHAKHEIDLAHLEDELSTDDTTQFLNDDNNVFERFGGGRAIYQILDSAVLLSVYCENYELTMSDLNAFKLLTDTSYFNSEDL
ncbi:cupin domain-containing protein, partial [Pseudoalteromonas aliena]